jgi:hypothetical protein
MPETFSFEVLESFGTLSAADNGWQKELTMVRWNEREPKYDIRIWSPSKDRMGRGVTFSKDELKTLKSILNQLQL